MIKIDDELYGSMSDIEVHLKLTEGKVKMTRYRYPAEFAAIAVGTVGKSAVYPLRGVQKILKRHNKKGRPSKKEVAARSKKGV